MGFCKTLNPVDEETLEAKKVNLPDLDNPGKNSHNFYKY